MSHLSSEKKLPQLGVLDQETIARFRDNKMGPYRILKSDYDVEELSAAVEKHLSSLQSAGDLDLDKMALEIIASRPGLARVNTEKLRRHTIRLLRERISQKEGEGVALQEKRE